MTRPLYVRGQLPVVPSGDWQPDKRTQPNPLRLSLFYSLIYIVSRQGEPIEVKTFISNWLRTKKTRFSRNMNGARLSIPDWQRRKLEIGNCKMTFIAVMCFRMSRYVVRIPLLIRNWTLAEAGWDRKLVLWIPAFAGMTRGSKTCPPDSSRSERDGNDRRVEFRNETGMSCRMSRISLAARSPSPI